MFDYLQKIFEKENILNIMLQKILPWLTSSVAALGVFLAGLVVGRLIASQVKKVVKTSQRHNSLVHYLALLAKYCIYIVTTVIALTILGVPTGSLIAILASSGFAVGFALKSHISNFASGLLLQFTRSVKLQDWIVIGSYEGEVKKMDLFMTVLKTQNQSTVLIPNNKLASDIIENKGQKKEQNV